MDNNGGYPARLYSDHGTENGIIAGVQCYLRSDGVDEYSGAKAHKYVPSTNYQRIECFWSSFRKFRAGWWIDFLNDLHDLIFSTYLVRFTWGRCGLALLFYWKWSLKE